MTLDPSDAADARLDRLHEAVRDLATRQDDLRRQLAAVVDTLERHLDAGAESDAVSAPVEIPPSRRFAAPTPRSLPGRLRSAIKHRLLGPVLARARALWRASRRIALPLWTPSTAAPPALSIGEIGEGDSAVERLRTPTTPLPDGVEALALHVMAVEGLAALRLLGPHGGERWDDLDLLLARADVVERALDGTPRLVLDRLPRDRPAAKTVRLFGDAEPLDVPPLPGGDDLVSTGPWAFHPRARRPPRPTLALGDIAPLSDRPSTAVVLTTPLTGGVDRFVARVVRAEAASRPVIVAQLAVEGPSPAHPVLDLGALCAAIWPLADLVPASYRDAVLRQLLRAHRVDRVLHVGSGDGLVDAADPGLRELLRDVRLVDLPLPRFPATTTTARPPAWVDLELAAPGSPTTEAVALRLPAEPGARPTPSAGTKADARRRLGLDVPEGETLVAWLCDLVPAERPEDAVALADRLRDEPIHLLLVGRGPSAGTVDDLARYLAPPRLRRLPTADPAEVLAAADLVVSTAESLPFPWFLEAARAADRPVIESRGTIDQLAAAVRDARAGEPPPPADTPVDSTWIDLLWPEDAP